MNLIDYFDILIIRSVDWINSTIGYRPVLRLLILLSIIALLISVFKTDIAGIFLSIGVLGALGLEFLYDAKVTEADDEL